MGIQVPQVSGLKNKVKTLELSHMANENIGQKDLISYLYSNIKSTLPGSEYVL